MYIDQEEEGCRRVQDHGNFFQNRWLRGNHCTTESKATNERNEAAKRFTHGDIEFHRQLVILYFDRGCT